MIDSHCHLDQQPLYDNLKVIIERSKNIGIEKLLTISTNKESFNKISMGHYNRITFKFKKLFKKKPKDYYLYYKISTFFT